MENIYEYLPLPEQHEGGEKNIETTVTTKDETSAKALYKKAKERLLNVNHWDKICGKLSAVFKLTDEKGNKVDSTAKHGCYFKIDVPGPGSSAGKGYDWVQVENIEEKQVNDDSEFIIMTVRPSDNPTTADDNVAHFFSDKATSNFVVKREGNMVTAAVYGRNEVPNTGTTNAIDKARNAIVGTGAIAGLSDPQWKSLANGLVKED